MKTETWTCDHCGKAGEGRPTLELTLYAQPEHKERHLCGDCVGALFDWIDHKGIPQTIIKIRGRRLSRKMAEQIREAAQGPREPRPVPR